MHRNIQCLRVTRVDYDDYGDHHANHDDDGDHHAYHDGDGDHHAYHDGDRYGERY